MKDMEKKIQSSNAPLFVCYGADPNCADQKTKVVTASEMLDILKAPENMGSGFENGMIVCAVTPIDFKYVSLDGKAVFGEVSAESLSSMLLSQKENE